MLKRLSTMFIVIAALCAMAYTIGGVAAMRKADTTGIPTQHPVLLALHFRQELALNGDQVSRLEQLRDAMAKEFAPFREQAESIQRQMQSLQQSSNPNAQQAKALAQQGDDLGAKIKPLFDRYSNSVAELLSPEQREKLMKLSGALSQESDQSDFPLMFIMQSREPIGVTPQQFTKLQYLQADFIRAFAPLREQMEMLQMEVQEKFSKEGKQPTSDYIARGDALKQSVKSLQSEFSDRAINEVLEPSQRATLKELLNGKHSPG